MSTCRNAIFLAAALCVGGCANCNDYGDLPDQGGRYEPSGEPGGYDGQSDGAFRPSPDAAGGSDAGGEDAADGLDLASLDADTGRGRADAGDRDAAADAETGSGDSGPTPRCGDGMTTPPEACDDGNTAPDDYCAADCTSVTGVCGDGILQGNESCDDGATTDCATTHDGGDGSCVPAGTCVSGYQLDGGGGCVPTNTTGLTTPCSNGPGWTLFRFHYSNNSTSAQLDVWDASCSYSFASGSACNVREVYPGFGEVSRTSQGYPIFTSTHYLRVRFDVNGLNFSSGTLWIQARSYSTGASTYFDAESILYGVREGGPVDNDFVYEWYDVDWTGFLYPSDDPRYTAIQLYGGRGSGSLAVSAVELCVQ